MKDTLIVAILLMLICFMGSFIGAHAGPVAGVIFTMCGLWTVFNSKLCD